jgi:hypothetical protein
MATNLSLLARIARGERSFRVPPQADPAAQQLFHQLVADARRLAVAGYIPAIRRSGEWRIPEEGVLDIEAPGVTAAGVAKLREAGLLSADLVDRVRREGTDG